MSTASAVGEGRNAGRLRPVFEWTPERITGLYVLLGFAALFVSDVLVVELLEEPLLSRVQAVKGGVEVVATAGFIYLLTRQSRSQLRRTNDTLGRQREELEVLHRVLRHNLRNALTVIAGTATYLRTDSTLASEDRAHCERIERRAERLAEMVEQASRIRRITERDDHRITVDLAGAVREALQRCDAPAADVTVDVPADQSVVVSPLFESALAELLDNALEHAGDATPQVDVAATVGAGTVTLTVADDGPGIPEYVRDVFDRGKFDQLVHLEGMGLWFAYWTITDAGGTFTIEDADGGGTRVVLTLQRARPPAVSIAPPKPA